MAVRESRISNNKHSGIRFSVVFYILFYISCCLDKDSLVIQILTGKFEVSGGQVGLKGTTVRLAFNITVGRFSKKTLCYVSLICIIVLRSRLGKDHNGKQTTVKAWSEKTPAGVTVTVVQNEKRWKLDVGRNVHNFPIWMKFTTCFNK